MKRIFFLFAISCSLLFSGEIKWEKSYKDATIKAMDENKTVMLMLSAHGCYACDFMRDGPLKADSITKYITENFVPVELIMFEDIYPKKFEAPGTPSFFFIDPKTDKRVGKDIIGGSKEKNFLKELKKATN